jgi:hypothetical protein
MIMCLLSVLIVAYCSGMDLQAARESVCVWTILYGILLMVGMMVVSCDCHVIENLSITLM